MDREWELKALCRSREPEIWFSKKSLSRAKKVCPEAILARESQTADTLRSANIARLTGAQWAKGAVECSTGGQAQAASQVPAARRALVAWRTRPSPRRTIGQPHLGDTHVGSRLYVEVLDYAPTTLTHREKLALSVLADDALDGLRGRKVDNAGFFHAANPRTVTDTGLYDGVTGQFAQWLTAARAAGILV
ncbi:VWA domain-containing protein [Streptomyces shenzhenensis]|uniref:VWA domain-containing protein n=1 Tax=Streptomyces shenzhenensis TaxID=943815 RepID=UPI0037FD960D